MVTKVVWFASSGSLVFIHALVFLSKVIVGITVLLGSVLELPALVVFPQLRAGLVFGRQCNWGDSQYILQAIGRQFWALICILWIRPSMKAFTTLDHSLGFSYFSWALLIRSHEKQRSISLGLLYNHYWEQWMYCLPVMLFPYTHTDHRPEQTIFFNSNQRLDSSTTITFTPKLKIQKIFSLYDLQWHWNRIYINIWKIFFEQLFIFVNTQTIAQTIDQSFLWIDFSLQIEIHLKIFEKFISNLDIQEVDRRQ